MNNQHPITPPPELIKQWVSESNHNDPLFAQVAVMAARWGSDTELEACCEWFQEFYKTESWVKHDLKHFRTARRPKPPSLKEQALTALSHLLSGSAQTLDTTEAEFYIRRALEALPND